LIDAARGMTLGDQLARRARVVPDLVAYRFGDRAVTFDAVDQRVNRLASALAGLGVGHGDRIVILMHNSIEFVEVFWAAARLGAISVPINFRLAGAEIGYLLENCGARVLIVDDAMADTARAFTDTEFGVDDPVVLVVGAMPDVAAVGPDRTRRSSPLELGHSCRSDPWISTILRSSSTRPVPPAARRVPSCHT
jgi:fatty-acyl-CoA synthase